MIALALVGCGPQTTYRAYQCVRISDNLVLEHADINTLSEMEYGFNGIDKDGYLHVVPKSDVRNWKCRLVTYRFAKGELE
jgi:hypothetical protein